MNKKKNIQESTEKVIEEEGTLYARRKKKTD